MNSFNGSTIANKDFGIVFTKVGYDKLLGRKLENIPQSIIISAAEENDTTRLTLLVTDIEGYAHVLAYDANLIQEKINALTQIANECKEIIKQKTGQNI